MRHLQRSDTIIWRSRAWRLTENESFFNFFYEKYIRKMDKNAKESSVSKSVTVKQIKRWIYLRFFHADIFCIFKLTISTSSPL